MMYARFVFCLGLGLVGVCMVLKTLIDAFFTDWNLLEELELLWKGGARVRRIRVEDEADGELAVLSTRVR